jgi:chromosome segregation ATPase
MADDSVANMQFASEENKQLEAELRRKEAELQSVEEKLEADGGRVKVMTDHLVNVQQELVNTQQLVDAKKSEAETEDHLKALKNRELGRLKAEAVRLQKLMDDIQDQVNVYANELMRGNEKLDQFKLQMNWNQEELEQWAVAARQKEEDELTLEKYRRADEAKVKELTLAIERLTVEIATKKKDLDDQVTETQAKQIEMEKTAELFRQLHEDRRKIITQWEDAVNSMQQRDNQLEKKGEEYAAGMARKKAKEDKMKEKKGICEGLESENNKLEQAIANTDRQLTKMRSDHLETKESLTQFRDECEVMKNQHRAVENEKLQAQNHHQIMATALEKREMKFQSALKAQQAHAAGLEEAINIRMDKDALSKQAEELQQEMANSLKAVDKEVKTAKENLYKESQALYQLRAQEATTLGEISGAQAAIKNLQFQISRLDMERQRQQELLYAVDFQSQLMQRKVARVSGERTVEERDDFNKKLEQLEKQTEEQKGLHTILTQQVKRQDAELKNANRALAAIKKESDSFKGVMEELELSNTNLGRTVNNTVKEKEESLMQHDVLKLEVKRLRQNLSTKSEDLYSLENRKQQLRISMEEREKEIEVHTEVLAAQKRGAEDERHKTAIELAERKQKIFTLKSKYDNILSKVKKDDGEEVHSQAHYMIKAAQEKEELQRKGDELDDKIKRAEREMRALENTLGHLVTRNQKYKENFQQANQQTQAESEEKQMLEEQSRAANEVLFKKKKQLSQLEREVEEDNQRFDELSSNLQQIDQHVSELAAAKDLLQDDINSRQDKLDRAEQALEVSRRRASQAGLEMGPEDPATLDIEAKALKHQNESVLHALTNALQEHPDDVLPLFESLCTERGLKRPSRPPSGASSRPGSGRM